MPNGFDNPYIDDSEINLGWHYMPGGDTPFGTETEGSLNLPFMSYQGISPEIMDALSNVLNISDVEGFNPFANLDLESWMDESQIVYDNDQLYYDFEQGLPPGQSPHYGTTEEYGSGTYFYSDGQWFTSEGDPVYTPYEFQDLEFTTDQDLSNLMSGVGTTNIFDPESLAATLSQIAGFTGGAEGEPIRAGEVRALTPEDIEKTTSAYYNPYEEAERDVLVDKKGTARGKVETGGFAGSGARTAGLSGAEKLYRGGYEDILGDIMKMRGSASADVLDTIYGWQELMGE